MNGTSIHMESDLFLSDLDQVHMQSYDKSAAYLISEVEFLFGFQVLLQWTIYITYIHIWADASIQRKLKQTNHIYGRVCSTEVSLRRFGSCGQHQIYKKNTL